MGRSFPGTLVDTQDVWVLTFPLPPAPWILKFRPWQRTLAYSTSFVNYLLAFCWLGAPLIKLNPDLPSFSLHGQPWRIWLFVLLWEEVFPSVVTAVTDEQCPRAKWILGWVGIYLGQTTIFPCLSISFWGALGVILLQELVVSSTEVNDKDGAGASGLHMQKLSHPGWLREMSSQICLLWPYNEK